MATVVQEEGHLPLSRIPHPFRPMTSPQVDTTVGMKAERMSVVRLVLWAAVFITLVVGMVLFFRYTKLMTPLL